jgi:hypothetical protein
MLTVAFSAGVTLTVKTIEDSPPCNARSSLVFSRVTVALGTGAEESAEGGVAVAVGVVFGVGVVVDGGGDAEPGTDPGTVVDAGAGVVVDVDVGVGAGAVVGVGDGAGAEGGGAVVVVVEGAVEGDVVVLGEAPAGPLATPPGPKSAINA